MHHPQSNRLEQIECPVRNKVISSMTCHTCPNHIRVLYKSEMPAELQCSRWTWSNRDETAEDSGADSGPLQTFRPIPS